MSGQFLEKQEEIISEKVKMFKTWYSLEEARSSSTISQSYLDENLTWLKVKLSIVREA